jgi:hypothetical protein
MWTDITVQELVFYVGIFVAFALGFSAGFRP